MLCRTSLIFVCSVCFISKLAAAPAKVEYPAHPTTYGDHTIAATWPGGPVATVSVLYETDENVLHIDGDGQSQRTARNTLNFSPPSNAANPQNFDNLALVGRYGSRFPQIQHLAAAGTSTMTYQFPTPVTSGFDLFVNDLDTSDDVTIRAFGPGNAAINMTTWSLAGEGDLSLFKNTGTDFSDVIAPTPTTVFSASAIQLTAVDSTNYNRSFSILRAPLGSAVDRVELEFTGIQNSPSRDFGGNGSHVYVLLSTLPDEPDFNNDGVVAGNDFLIWQRGYDTFNGNANRTDGDANRDGLVNGLDLTAWQEQYGTEALAPAIRTVPEPSTIVLIGLSWLTISVLSRRGRA